MTYAYRMMNSYQLCNLNILKTPLPIASPGRGPPAPLGPTGGPEPAGVGGMGVGGGEVNIYRDILVCIHIYIYIYIYRKHTYIAYDLYSLLCNHCNAYYKLLEDIHPT